jgi:hypothetical protein
MDCRALLFLGLCCASCASGASTSGPTTPATTSGAESDGTVARAALGLAFRLPNDWSAQPVTGSVSAQWNGPTNTAFLVGSDPAPTEDAHERVVASLRTRAAQLHWTLSREQRAPSLGPAALALEVTIAPQLGILRMSTWVTLVGGQLAVVSCAFDRGDEQRAAPVCARIMASISRSPRPAPEGARAVSLGSLSAAIPSDWTDARQGDVLVFASPDQPERQIALSAALSPRDTRLTTIDAPALRARLSANGATVSEAAAREVNELPGYEFSVEQPQLRRAGVSQLMLFVHQDSKTLSLACAFRTDDTAGRAQCTRAISSVQRAR